MSVMNFIIFEFSKIYFTNARRPGELVWITCWLSDTRSKCTHTPPLASHQPSIFWHNSEFGAPVWTFQPHQVKHFQEEGNWAEAAIFKLIWRLQLNSWRTHIIYWKILHNHVRQWLCCLAIVIKGTAGRGFQPKHGGGGVMLRFCLSFGGIGGFCKVGKIMRTPFKYLYSYLVYAWTQLCVVTGHRPQPHIKPAFEMNNLV